MAPLNLILLVLFFLAVLVAAIAIVYFARRRRRSRRDGGSALWAGTPGPAEAPRRYSTYDEPRDSYYVPPEFAPAARSRDLPGALDHLAVEALQQVEHEMNGEGRPEDYELASKLIAVLRWQRRNESPTDRKAQDKRIALGVRKPAQHYLAAYEACSKEPTSPERDAALDILHDVIKDVPAWQGAHYCTLVTLNRLCHLGGKPPRRSLSPAATFDQPPTIYVDAPVPAELPFDDGQPETPFGRRRR